MGITVKAYQPINSTTSVRFPDSKKQFTIPTSEGLTVGQLRAIQGGDIDAFISIFPDDAAKEIDKLHPSQLAEFVKDWLAAGTSENGDAPKD